CFQIPLCFAAEKEVRERSEYWSSCCCFSRLRFRGRSTISTSYVLIQAVPTRSLFLLSSIPRAFAMLGRNGEQLTRLKSEESKWCFNVLFFNP
ncbi:hypothetical protein LINPERHAP2_LOCUS23436, partial [Linum perenne]